MVEDQRTGPDEGDAEAPATPAEQSAPEPDQASDAGAGPEAAGPPEAEAAEDQSADRSSEDAGERVERRPDGREDAGEPEAAEVVPGADLEPDLVLDETPDEDRYTEDAYAAPPEASAEAQAEPAPEDHAGEPDVTPAPRSPMKLAADARYQATGKRKTSVARVILKPGNGAYTVNGRSLEEFFPRPTLQKTARQPLSTAGYDNRMDVVAKLHGGGVSAQAGALRHGVARALVEADPNLRGDLKRRGFLTRDPRVKERKKAGLKKARKRPQFSKR